MIKRSLFSLMAMGFACLLSLQGCDDKPDAQTGKGSTLRIVAGSETKPLEPMLKEWSNTSGVNVSISYLGSVDLQNQLNSGKGMDADVVWPANHIWIESGDVDHVVKGDDSIMRTPVVFGVRKPLAQKLGWDKKSPSIAEILVAIQADHLKLAMTSATQSNSGAQGLFGILHAFSGKQTALTLEDLQKPELQEKVRDFLSNVSRSSGSSGWLGDFVAQNPDSVDLFINYEAVLLQTNKLLADQGKEPFFAVYPVDGLTVADHTMGFIARSGTPGEEARFAAYNNLKNWLLADTQQAQISQLGWRTGKVGIEMPDADPNVFRSAWGVDATRTVSAIPLPTSEVVAAALELYQGGGLRKPSFTVILYDVSGSMSGKGVREARAGLQSILDQAQAKKILLQAGPKDVFVIQPFRDFVEKPLWVQGNKPEDYSRLLGSVMAVEAGGGTDFYTPILQYLDRLQKAQREGYLPALILMTDGMSDINSNTTVVMNRLKSRVPAENIPIFSIMYGDADPSQLNQLARATGAQVFDGRKDLVRAFKNARGYN